MVTYCLSIIQLYNTCSCSENAGVELVIPYTCKVIINVCATNTKTSKHHVTYNILLSGHDNHMQNVNTLTMT